MRMLPTAEEKMGCDIVAKSLRAPVRLIASNAGVEGDVIIEKLLGKPFEIGYNAVRTPDLLLVKSGQHHVMQGNMIPGTATSANGHCRAC